MLAIKINRIEITSQAESFLDLYSTFIGKNGHVRHTLRSEQQTFRIILCIN